MTREPPLNWVGVTFASSAPWTVSNTSLATFRPSWTNAAPMTVRAAATRSNEPWLAAMRMPSTTGTIVAVRNGRRVVRSVRKPNDSRGLTGVPRSADRASKYWRECGTERSEYSKNGTSASSQPQAHRPIRVRTRAIVSARIPGDTGPRPSRGAARRSRSRAAAGCASRSARRRGRSGRPDRRAARRSRSRLRGSMLASTATLHRIAGVVDPRWRSGTGRWPACRGRRGRRARGVERITRPPSPMVGDLRRDRRVAVRPVQDAARRRSR